MDVHNQFIPRLELLEASVSKGLPVSAEMAGQGLFSESLEARFVECSNMVTSMACAARCIPDPYGCCLYLK